MTENPFKVGQVWYYPYRKTLYTIAALIDPPMTVGTFEAQTTTNNFLSSEDVEDGTIVLSQDVDETEDSQRPEVVVHYYVPPEERVTYAKPEDTSKSPYHYSMEETEEVVQDPFAEQVWAVLDRIGNLLIEKNEAYGNSALDPIRIFSKADTLEQLRVRIDDKLNRLAKGREYPSEDTVDDLLGYLVLYKIGERNG